MDRRIAISARRPAAGLGGGVVIPVTHTQYALSVYEAWMALHRSTVEKWYERYVVPDRVAADGKPNSQLRTLEDSRGWPD
jgi:hypothetical protein